MRSVRPELVILKFVGGLTDHASGHWANFLARGSHQGSLAQSIEDARESARVKRQRLHRFRVEDRGARYARDAQACVDVIPSFLECQRSGPATQRDALAQLT